MSDSNSMANEITTAKEGFSVVPKHIAFIMDGNGRWAKLRGQSATSGHKAGVEAVRKVLDLSMAYGIEVVTLFAFSSENWRRPALEVRALMTLFGSYLNKEVASLHSDGIRIRFIGCRDNFSKSLLRQMEAAERLTASNIKATLVIAVDYGGQWDIANAAKQVALRVQQGLLTPDDITVESLGEYIALADLPAPDLCVRTADEHRISNFLLWQLAYAELFFSKSLWPDFSDTDLREALTAFAARDRRFGGRNEV